MIEALRRSLRLAIALALVLLSPHFAIAQTAPPPTNTLFIINNQTGLPNSSIFVKFLGGVDIVASATPQTYAGLPGDISAQLLSTGASTSTTSYSLQQMSSLLTLPGSTTATMLPNFSINNLGGGRIYFSLMNPLASTLTPGAQNSLDPDFNTTYQYIEPYIQGVTGNTSNNIDLSYIDFTAMPMNIQAYNTSGQPLSIANNPLTSMPGTTMFNAAAQASTTPGANILANGARVIGSSLGGQFYHNWSSYINKLAIYTSLGGGGNVRIKGAFVGSGAGSGALYNAQDYDLTAIFDNNSQSLKLFGIGTANVHTPASGAAGTINIEIAYSALNASTGIYGNNPVYTITTSAGTSTTTGIVNDLSGRIVGDIMAGMVLGWAGSSTLQPGGVGTIGELTSTEFFNLLTSLPKTSSTGDPTQSDYLFGSLQTNSDHYDTYAASIFPYTDGYGTAFLDRLGSTAINWDPGATGYIEVTLLNPTPEPGYVLLITCLGLLMGYAVIRRWKLAPVVNT